MDNLTLTSVVFELKCLIRFGRSEVDLTLTSVVFELDKMITKNPI